MFEPLPPEDDALILRKNAHRHGFPKPATLAKWASRPGDAPIELPYVIIGREAAYLVGTLRRLRKAMTFRNTAERSVASATRKKRRYS